VSFRNECCLIALEPPQNSGRLLFLPQICVATLYQAAGIYSHTSSAGISLSGGWRIGPPAWSKITACGTAGAAWLVWS
jgi:hypothetical protein